MQRALLMILCVSAVTGCTWLAGGPRQGTSSSLVAFLYPDGEAPPTQQGIPHLLLPVRAGIAFVPSTQYGTDSGLSEARKQDLLKRTKEAFVGRDFISSIEVIPETYLRGRRGFEAIDQIARMYNLDVIALVSYDQVTFSEDTKASILYWTIVGAYFIPGSKHDIQTLVDTAVFDVKTRKLLFRGPGSSTLAKTSTLVNSAEALRAKRDESFGLAMDDMTKSLNAELDVFRERIKTEGVATVAQRDGGGGALDLPLLLFLVLLAVIRRRLTT